MKGFHFVWIVIIPICWVSCGPDLQDCRNQLVQVSLDMEQAMDSGEFSLVEVQLDQVRSNHDCVLVHPQSSQIQKEEARAILVLAESMHSGIRCRQSVDDLESFIFNLNRLKGRMASDSLRVQLSQVLQLIDEIEQDEVYLSCLDADQDRLNEMRLTIEGMKLESSFDDVMDDLQDIIESTLIEVQDALR